MPSNLTPILDDLAGVYRELVSMDEKITRFRDEILGAIDEVLVILKRHDQETTFHGEILRRHGEQLDLHAKDISKLKRTKQV